MNDKLITDNIGLIYMQIKNLHLYHETEDEFQEYFDNGLIGLIKGAKEYDESKGKASTFLSKCIKNEILYGITLKTMKKRTNEFGPNISLYTEIPTSEDTYLIDCIEDINENVEEKIENKLMIEKLMYAIDNALNPREKEMICQHYGLNGYEKITVLTIAAKHNISRKRTYEILKNSIKKLNKYLTNNTEEVFHLKKKR